MEIPDITTTELGSGQVITTCEEHGWEVCHRCCFDFREMNDMARREHKMEVACTKPMGKGLLPQGSVVRMPMENRADLVGEIVGFVMDDLHEIGEEVACYVVKLKVGDKSRFVEEVETVHESYTVEGRTVNEILDALRGKHKGRTEQQQ